MDRPPGRRIHRTAAPDLQSQGGTARRPPEVGNATFLSAVRVGLDESCSPRLGARRQPALYPAFQRMGFEPGSLPDFSLMAAITLVDTVVSHEPFTDRLLFHELVHVVQYEKLGLAEFAAKYVK